MTRGRGNGKLKRKGVDVWREGGREEKGSFRVLDQTDFSDGLWL